MGNQPVGPDGGRPTDAFGSPRPTRVEREAAALEKHGDGMSPVARLELVRQIAKAIKAAKHSIEVAVEHQVITFSYPGDPHVCTVAGTGRTITIKIDGGHDSGMIGTVPVGTFPNHTAAPGSSADTPGPRPIPTSDRPKAGTGATDASRGQDEGQG